MTTKMGKSKYKEPPKAERDALRALAFLFEKSEYFRSTIGSVAQRTLNDLGLSEAQAAYVLSVLKWRAEIADGLVDSPALARFCPIGWSPTISTPVFWGREQVAIGPRAIPTTIYYPSLDGSPDSAPLLADCGKYPLILFLHGHCPHESDHLGKWTRHLAQLARSGFVVAAPLIGSIAAGPTRDEPLADATEVLHWMREYWPKADCLLPAARTGVFGHSYGGMLACRIAASQPVKAYASLSAGWHEWQSFGSGLRLPLLDLADPSLHVWGTEASLDAITDQLWTRIALPRHRLVLDGAEHWAYLHGTSGGCAPTEGPCNRLGGAALDLLTAFFAKYLATGEPTAAGASIPETLVPPTVPLSFEQQFYAGGHLVPLRMLQSQGGCKIVSSWDRGHSAAMVSGSTVIGGP